MSILDFLKRKKEVEKAKEKKPFDKDQGKPEKKVEKVLDTKEVKATSDKGQATRKRKEAKGFSYEVVREPHISEKGTNLGEQNKYVFKVYKNVNKPEIKKAVEGIYGVDVVSVNVIKIPRKKRRLGRTAGFRKGYSKAVVTVREGQKIEIF